MAEHGHVFEQEWAFGIGISSTIRWTAKSECVKERPYDSITRPKEFLLRIVEGVFYVWGKTSSTDDI